MCFEIFSKRSLEGLHTPVMDYTISADEPGYFTVIRDMLDGVWCSPWSFTVGLGFLYLPFILISGAREFYDIVPVFNYFSALVFGPCILLLFCLVLRRLGVSGKNGAFYVGRFPVGTYYLYERTSPEDYSYPEDAPYRSITVSVTQEGRTRVVLGDWIGAAELPFTPAP